MFHRGETEMAALEATVRTIGRKVQPHCLTLSKRRRPRARRSRWRGRSWRWRFAARGINSEPLLAHSFERVMPGSRVRFVDPRFLAGLLRLQRRVRARVEKFLFARVPTRAVPANGDGLPPSSRRRPR